MLVAASFRIYWKNRLGARRVEECRNNSLNDAFEECPRMVLSSTLIARSKGTSTSDEKTDSTENSLELMRQMIDKLKENIQNQNVENKKQHEDYERQFKTMTMDIDNIKNPK